MLKPIFVNSWITHSLKSPKKAVHCPVWFHFKTDLLITNHSNEITFIIDPFITGMSITDNLHNGGLLYERGVLWTWPVMKWFVMNGSYKRGPFRVVCCESFVLNGHRPVYSMLWKESKMALESDHCEISESYYIMEDFLVLQELQSPFMYKLQMKSSIKTELRTWSAQINLV